MGRPKSNWKKRSATYSPKSGAFFRSLQNQVDSSGQNLNLIKDNDCNNDQKASGHVTR